MRGVLTHRASREHAYEAMKALGYPSPPAMLPDFLSSLHGALRDCDALAGVFARLLLWTLPSPLPLDEDAGWKQYIAAWRPGQPHRDRWILSWHIATEAIP